MRKLRNRLLLGVCVVLFWNTAHGQIMMKGDEFWSVEKPFRVHFAILDPEGENGYSTLHYFASYKTRVECETNKLRLIKTAQANKNRNEFGRLVGIWCEADGQKT